MHFGEYRMAPGHLQHLIVKINYEDHDSTLNRIFNKTLPLFLVSLSREMSTL